MMLLLSAPAVKAWIVAVTNSAKLDMCTACHTRRGIRRIAQEVT
jgi:sulfur relay (sulfurtransferase) complex TusBCD TusD component (DsrE family)